MRNKSAGKTEHPQPAAQSRTLAALNDRRGCAPLGGAPDGAEKALWAIGTNEAEPVKPRASRAMPLHNWRVFSVQFYTPCIATDLEIVQVCNSVQQRPRLRARPRIRQVHL